LNDATFNPWHKYRISNNLDQKYKDIILHNLNQIAFKSSRLGNNYTVADLVSYQPSGASTSEFMAKDLLAKPGFQRNYTLSNSDKIAIFSIGGNRLDMRIFVNQTSQMLMGFHMVSLSKDGEVAELIEVFFE